MPLPVPPSIVEPFAVAGNYNLIPVPAPSPGLSAASFTSGFPAITSVPASAGGKAPARQDMNGILYMITAHLAALQGGQPYLFNAATAASIGGYALGAVVGMADGTGLWLNTVANNSNNPDTSAAATSGWTPITTTNGRTLVALSGSNVTLTAAQAEKSVIVFNGAMTANITVTVPTGRVYAFVNATTGNFTISISTPTNQTMALLPYMSPPTLQFIYVDISGFYTANGTNGVTAVQVNGYASALITNLAYNLQDGIVTYYLPAGNTNSATSNANTLTISGVGGLLFPPRTDKAVPCMLMDNGASLPGWALISASTGTVSFGLGATPNYSGFTASGTKGFGDGFTLSYPI